MSRALIVGPDLDAKGGVSTVIGMYRDAGWLSRHAFLATTTDGTNTRKVGFFALFLLKYLGILLFQPDIRVVHAHVAVRGSMVRKSLVLSIARLFRRKTVLHFHGARFQVLYDRSPGWMRGLIRHTFRRADRVLCLNRSCRGRIKEITGAQDVRLLYNPTILKKPVAQWGKTVNFLFMGRLGERKGVFDLIDAVSRMTAQNVGIHLYGDGDLDEVRKAIRHHNVGDRVHLQGWISGDEKARAFRDAHVLVLPSYNEGMPMSILEAMAYGMPVISTPIAGIPECVQDGVNGYLIPPGDRDALAQKMDALAESLSLRQRMGEAGYQRAAEAFEIHVVLHELGDLYRELDPAMGHAVRA